MKPLWFLFVLCLLLANLTKSAAGVAIMADGQKPTTDARDSGTDSREAGVVNWNPPAKRDLLERALSDGITDPAEIVEWAKKYKVSMTIEEVRRFKEGREEGDLKGELKILRRQIEKRFGSLPNWAEERLAECSAKEIEELSVRVLDAKSIESLLK
jgi:hypothetical protein